MSDRTSIEWTRGDDGTRRPVSVAFALLADYALALGAAPLVRHVGCWERMIGERWWVALNGHGTPARCSRGMEVPPFHAYFEHRGIPAGLITPFGGTIAAGATVHEDDLIAELRAATHGVTQ